MPNIQLDTHIFGADVFQAYANPATAKRAPQKVEPLDDGPVGETLEMANDVEIVVYREASAGVLTDKRSWKISWERVPEGTRTAVRAIARLGTAFTAVLPDGTFTVQVRPGTLTQEVDEHINATFGIAWNLSLEIVKTTV